MQFYASLKQLLVADLVGKHPLKTYAQRLLRAIYAVIRDLATGQLTMRSMSLSFSSLLSMVPMLAFSFSVLKGFGVHNYMEPILNNFLEPMGDGGRELSANIMAFVDNMNVAVLGSAGLLILIFTVVSLVKKVEESFNYIWNVKRGRGAIEQLRDYLSVILVGPMLAVSAAGLATTLQQSDLVLEIQQFNSMGALLVGFLRFTPKLIVFAIFIFIYAFIPNTRVKWLAAAAGALVAAILWLVAGWGFTSFVASSSKYTAIYSSFAVLILFLIWLNINWLFVLMGANIAYYVQYPDQMLLERGKLRPSARTRERVAMQAMFKIGRDYEVGEIRWNKESLRHELNIPGEVIRLVLQDMVEAGLLVKTVKTANEQAACYLPGRSCDRILLEDIVGAVSRAGQSYGKNHNWDERVQQVFDQFEAGARDALRGSTLADLVRAEPIPEPGHQPEMSPQHE